MKYVLNESPAKTTNNFKVNNEEIFEIQLAVVS